MHEVIQYHWTPDDYNKISVGTYKYKFIARLRAAWSIVFSGADKVKVK
jgi:hypothetical protein